MADTLPNRVASHHTTGPGIPNNGLALSVGPSITLSWPSFLTNYVLKATSDLGAPDAWITVTNTPVSTNGQLTVSLEPAPGNRFYSLAPKGP